MRSTRRRSRNVLGRLVFIGATLGILGSSLAVSQAYAVGGVCDGFAQNAFVDANRNGIADSNGIMATPWFDVVTTDLDAHEYEFDVPLGSSVQNIRSSPVRFRTWPTAKQMQILEFNAIRAPG